MKIAVIPARGGSKRIPRKNIKQFCGKPIIAWSIEAAKNSKMFDLVIVSTDDDEITEVALKWGAELPFKRPASIADDYTGTNQVMRHATGWALEQGLEIEAVCCIYATAPFLQLTDLARGWEVLESGNWAYAFAATEYAAPIFRSFEQLGDGGLQMFFPEYFNVRSQDLPKALHDAGQFYWGRPSAWLEGKPVFDHYSCPILIPRWRVLDIDSMDDWDRAEIIAPTIMNKKV